MFPRALVRFFLFASAVTLAGCGGTRLERRNPRILTGPVPLSGDGTILDDSLDNEDSVELPVSQPPASQPPPPVLGAAPPPGMAAVLSHEIETDGPIAAGDTHGDTTPELILGAKAGTAPIVRVLSTGGPSIEFAAYDLAFTGGVFVAAGDLDGDGRDEIVTSPGYGGGSDIRIWRVSQANRVDYLGNFAAFPGFTGGSTVAATDWDSDGRADIIVGAGPGGGPHVKVFSWRPVPIQMASFMVFEGAFSGGLFVAGADVDGDGFGDAVVGAGPTGGPRVTVVSGRNQSEIRNFWAYNTSFSGGVRVAAGDLNGDGFAEILTAAGPGGGPHIRLFDGLSQEVVLSRFTEHYSQSTAGVYPALFTRRGLAPFMAVTVVPTAPSIQGDVSALGLGDPSTFGVPRADAAECPQNRPLRHGTLRCVSAPECLALPDILGKPHQVFPGDPNLGIPGSCLIPVSPVEAVGSEQLAAYYDLFAQDCLRLGGIPRPVGQALPPRLTDPPGTVAFTCAPQTFCTDRGFQVVDARGSRFCANPPSPAPYY